MITIAAILAGSTGMAALPRRSSTLVNGIGPRFGRSPEVNIVQAFRFRLCAVFSPMITLISEHGRLAELPTEVVGTMWPLLGDAQRFDDGDVGTLDLMVAHLLHGVRQVLVDEHDLTCVDRLAQYRVPNGMRRASRPAESHLASRSLPRLAPVTGLICSFSSLARSINARGTALASPARVKPLMPTVMPSRIRKQPRGAHDLCSAERQADAIRIHLPRTNGQFRGRSLLRLKTLEPSTKVVEKNAVYGQMHDSSEAAKTADIKSRMTCWPPASLSQGSDMVGRVGFEPTTNWLKANCSTN